MKTISVIVPIYNVEKYLERCINSIINQTYKELEIILIDDASSDDSWKICEQMARKDVRIKIYRNEENLGTFKTRNIGIQKSTGNLIGFVDSDDTIDVNMFEILVNNLEKYDADISACKGKDILLNGEIRGEVKDNDIIIYKGDEILVNFLESEKDISIGICDKIFKKDIVNNININDSIKINEDKLFSYYAIKKCKIYVQQNISKYNYYIRKNSISNSANFTDYNDIIKVSKIIEEDIEQFGNQKQKESAKINFQLAILSACRMAIMKNEIKEHKGEYKRLVKEFQSSNVNYNLLKGKKRKIECFLLKNLPILYILNVKIYNWRKKK